LVAEGSGLFLEVLEAFGGAGGGGFEGFVFIIWSLVDDHAVEDAGEFVGDGDETFGFAEAGFEAAAKLAYFVVAARDALGARRRARATRLGTLRVLDLSTLPPEMRLSGHRPIHEAKAAALAALILCVKKVCKKCAKKVNV
jgi:hypothetical protein